MSSIMEMNYLISFALALPIITLILFYTMNSNNNKKKSNNNNLPPGSFGWPIVGETLAFVNEEHDKFIGERMRKYSPEIFKTKILGEKMVVLCGTAGHKFIAANEGKLFLSWRPHSMQKLFRSSYQKAASVVIPREAELQVMKVLGFLSPESLYKNIEEMDSLVSQHLSSYWDGKNVVEVHHLAQLLVLTFSCRFFAGLDDPARVERLSRLMHVMMFALHVTPINVVGTVFYKGMKAANRVRSELVELIREKKEAMARGVEMKDSLAFLIMNRDSTGRSMPENEIADKVMGLLAATFNSPAMAVSYMVKYIGERPHVYEKVRSEQMEIARSKKGGEGLKWDDIKKMKYTWNVALEVMRVLPPIQGTFREAITDFTYKGYTVPKGWKIYWTVSTTNMNREYFSDPEEFDPSRFERSPLPPFSNIPFGSGPRICPGKDFARLQILTFFHQLVRKFKWEVVNPNCKHFGGMNPIPIEDLKIRLQSCSS